jgi:solute carrier family 25 citrate transporter 1
LCLADNVLGWQTKPRGFIATGMQIASRETPLALYKGLGAVLSGIVPKMAIRFASFEAYKDALADNTTGKTSTGMVFLGESSTILICLLPVG